MQDRYDIDKINGFYLKVGAGAPFASYEMNGDLILGPDWKEIVWSGVSAPIETARNRYIRQDTGVVDLLGLFRNAGAKNIKFSNQFGWSNQSKVMTCTHFVRETTYAKVYPVMNGEIQEGVSDFWSAVFFSLWLIVRPKDW